MLGSRRRFLKQAGSIGIAGLSLFKRWAHAEPAPSSPCESPGFLNVLENRAPLTPNAFHLLPLGSVRAAGWLRDQLKIQASGLSGHLDETWADVDRNSGWLGGTGEAWERGPYFVDGLVPLAYLLNDTRLKAKAQRFIDWTLASQKADGFFGPVSNNDWWPRMVMLKALAQYHEATGDCRVLPFLSRYFACQLRTLPGRPLREWGRFRWQDNALVVIWLYNRTSDPALIQLARLLHQQGYDWQAQYADFKYTQRITPAFLKLNEGNGLRETSLATHGVNNGQALKAAPVWSVITGDEADRRGIHRMLDALDTYHGLPNGIFSCDEHLAGRNPSQGSELCSVVETMFSLEQSLAILGDAELGDRLEKLTFNALPGAFTDDMWAHQYNQEPNQVEVSLHTKPWTTDGPESNLYGLEPNFGCCTANFHQGWPKFAASLWMASHEGGLVAACYSPCEVDTLVANVRVNVKEQTDYPFRDTIRITVNPALPLKFPIHLRLPAWTVNPVVTVNSNPQLVSAPGTFAKIDRVWKAGDVVTLKFPMEPRLIHGFNDSISIDRGPLVFSFPIGEDWVKLRDRGMTADWQVFPQSAWNYAIAVDGDVIQGLKVIESSIGAAPFKLKDPPVKLQVEGHRVLSWRAIDGVADDVPNSPVAGSEAAETITLVPYAAAKLRITAFPCVQKSTPVPRQNSIRPKKSKS